MEQPARPPDCNLIEHIWDELGRAIIIMDNPPVYLSDLCQALLDKCADIHVERLQCLIASMRRRLAAIIAARCGNTRYWPSMHKTIPTGNIMKKKSSLLDQIYHNYHPMTLSYAHEIKFSNINKCHHKFIKIDIKKIVHTVHSITINPANQPANRPHKQKEYE